MTLRQLWAENAERLRAADIAEAELDARILLLEAFQTDLAHFLAEQVRPLPETEAVRRQIERDRDLISERARRRPLSYILGRQEFMGLTFAVDERVLIPRQDTETLVELVLEEQKDPGLSVLDLCTGSGCIAVSLAALGGYAETAAADLSEAALDVAEANARELLDETWEVGTWRSGKLEKTGNDMRDESDRPASGRRHFRLYCGDLFGALPPGKKYDILVSNPPYIPAGEISGLQAEVSGYEPRMALDGAADGLIFYRRIAAEAPLWLRPGGSVYLEIGYDQAEAVCGLLAEQGFWRIRVFKDLPGHDRVVRASL